MQKSNWQVYNHDGHRKYLTFDETLRFLNVVRKLPLRERLFCLLLAYSGCRISEGLALRRSCLGDGHIVLLTLKQRQRKFRRVPVPKPLIRLLAALAAESADSEQLWAVNRTTAYRWVKRVMMLAEIDGIQASPKGLRHGFGIRCAKGRTPANLIQKWMGHEWATTTFVYMDAVDDDEYDFAERTWAGMAFLTAPPIDARSYVG